jgi:hypothetical protein
MSTVHTNFIMFGTFKQLCGIILTLIPCIVEYVENNEQNALNSILLYFFTMAPTCFGKKKCRPQGANLFLSEPLQRQNGKRQVIGRMTGPTYRRVMTCLLPHLR